MHADLYSRVMDAIDYALSSTASRRDPKVLRDTLAVRDEMAATFPQLHAQHTKNTSTK